MDFRRKNTAKRLRSSYQRLSAASHFSRAAVGEPGVKKVTKKGRKPADKPGSVADSHSSWRTVTRALQRPTRRQREPRYRPLRGLAPDGVYPAARVATNAVRSYRTISPLPARERASAVSFLWHFPSP